MKQLLDEIQDFNLSYLMLAQRLLKEDYATAQFRLKLDDAMAEAIMALSTKELGRLARTNQFLYRLCFHDATQLTKILDEKRDPSLLQMHASMLMDGVAGNA